MIRLDKGELPWAPLVPGGEGLNRYPEEPVALRRRMAELWHVPEACVLPVRGALHGLELVCRALRLDGVEEIGFRNRSRTEHEQIAQIYGLRQVASAPVAVWERPDAFGGVIGIGEAMVEAETAKLAVFDETGIEFGVSASLVHVCEARPAMVVLRDLGAGYGLAGAACGAVVAAPETIGWIGRVLEPHAVPTPIRRAAEAVLAPARMFATQARWMEIGAEQDRVAEALSGAESIKELRRGDGNWIALRLDCPEAARLMLAEYGVRVGALPEQGPDWLRATIGLPAENDLLIAGLRPELPWDERVPSQVTRCAEVVRDTKETKIVCAVDLDRTAPVRIATGIGFYDHMLEQVARHGGFSLILQVEGDLHIEAHHSIEDAALALGEALRQALGDRAGLARFGFVAPLDEAEAAVTLDLSGRPLCKFTGAFRRPMIGDYPTEMTPHVFRSIADALRATIHVKVDGEDDHHQIEACFKSFGRALRQAITREGGGIPSTKGVLA